MPNHPSAENDQDIFTDEDVIARRRGALLPWWLHLLLGACMAMDLFALLIVSFSLKYVDAKADDSMRLVVFSIFAAVGAFICGNIAGKILVWCRWNHAVGFALAPAILLCLTSVVFVAYFSFVVATPSVVGIFLPYLLLNVAVTIRLYTMLREWKALPR